MASISCFARLILFVIKLGVFCVTGELTINSSPSYAVVDRDFTISCVSNTSILTTIIWEGSNGFYLNVSNTTCGRIVDNYQVTCSEALKNVSLTFPRPEILSMHNSRWNCTEENSNNSASYIVNVNVPVKSTLITVNGSNVNNNASWIHGSYVTTLSCKTSPSRPPAVISMTIQNVLVTTQQQVREDSAYNNLYTTSIEVRKVPGRKKTLAIKCYASNMDGNVDRATTVNIIYPPSLPVIKLSSPFPWNLGDNASLKCDSDSGNPSNTTYKWLENDILLTLENQQNIKLPLTPDFNDRKYSCYATNGAASSDKSAATKLIVYYAPGKPQISTTHFPWKEGQTQKLTCLSNPGNPMQTYEWRVNGNLALSGTSSTFSLGRLSRTDNRGRYSCRVYNSFTQKHNWNNMTSSTLTINVNYAPIVTVVTPTQMTEGDTNVQFRCIADGNPVQYTFKEWEHIVDSRIVRKLPGNATIFFKNMSYEDSGIYKCSAENGVTDSANVLIQTGSKNVVVYAKPVIFASQTSFICNEYRSLVVSVSFISIPIWNTAVHVHNNITKNFAPVKTRISVVFHQTVSVEGYVVSYSISRCSKADNGTYTLRFGNNLGMTEKKIFIRYSGKPEPPSTFQMVSSGTTSLKLSWSAGFDGGHLQTFIVTYVGEKNNTIKLVETQLTVIDIDNLQQDLAYVFWLRSKNSKGMSPKSLPLIARTNAISQDHQSLNPGSIGILCFGLLLTVSATCVIVWHFRQELQGLIRRLRSDERTKDTKSQRVYENTSFNQESTSKEHGYVNVSCAEGNISGAADEEHGDQQLYEGLTAIEERPYEALEKKHETKKLERPRKNANKPLPRKVNADEKKDIYQNVGIAKTLARKFDGAIALTNVRK